MKQFLFSEKQRLKYQAYVAHPDQLPIQEKHDIQQQILAYYQCHARDLPWRKTTNPYHILISEIMLQQTQVSRVMDKYESFLSAFPTIQSLCNASFEEVLTAWQGLGYNRRALNLKRCACEIVKNHRGKIPDQPAQLQHLPGIGKATAASICVYAFNKPAVFLETNIRTTLIYLFHLQDQTVSDSDLHKLAQTLLYTVDPFTWYQALMDYGTQLKKLFPDLQKAMKAYTKQKPFKGSNRQLRGQIIALLLSEKHMDIQTIKKHCHTTLKRIRPILHELEAEKFIIYHHNRYKIAQ